jgi:uracil-DNA glycosylase
MASMAAGVHKTVRHRPSSKPVTTLARVRADAANCRACDLWKHATQTVFGEGKPARLMFVGEQPGNDEDLQGRPFVGPAGRLLDQAMSEAGIDRTQTYITNVVKHFKFEERGKRRIHKKPNSVEVSACLPWLESEIALVKPDIVVALGATAAQALLGSTFRVTQHRGEFLKSKLIDSRVMATVHPSSLLRAPDPKTRRREYRRFVEDLSRLKEVPRATEGQ